MPQQTLDYRRSIREVPDFPWYRSDLAIGAVTASVIVAANSWLVWQADKSWGFWLWVFLLIPLANAALAGVLLACSPIARRVSGASASVHVWVALAGCVSAVFADATIILGLLHGC